MALPEPPRTLTYRRVPITLKPEDQALYRKALGDALRAELLPEVQGDEWKAAGARDRRDTLNWDLRRAKQDAADAVLDAIGDDELEKRRDSMMEVAERAVSRR